jgi:hypothetical protein
MKSNDSGLVLNLVSLVGVIVFVYIIYQLLGNALLNSAPIQILIHAFGG